MLSEGLGTIVAGLGKLLGAVCGPLLSHTCMGFRTLQTLYKYGIDIDYANLQQNRSTYLV